MRVFRNANEILEAWKWLAEQDSDATDKAELKTINLLGPSLATVESARKFVEQVKEDFPNLVHHCCEFAVAFLSLPFATFPRC